MRLSGLNNGASIMTSTPSSVNILSVVRAKAPGKLFWSGEHAVVYDSMAMLMAVEPGVTSDLFWVEQSGYWLEENGTVYYLDEDGLQALVTKLQFRYRDFVAGRRSIVGLLENSYQLVAYHVAQVLKRWPNLRQSPGIYLRWTWGLVPGCGMGGSASLLWSVTRVLVGAQCWDWKCYYDCLVDSENLQHGHTSGLDIMAQAEGGMHIYQTDGHGHWCTKPVSLNYPFCLVYTGTPVCSTGECVMWAATQFKKQPDLLLRGKQVVVSVIESVLNGDFEWFLFALKSNQAWLEELGVVPVKLQAFRKIVNRYGGVFKLTGAGAVRGEGGGVGLLLGDGDWEQMVNNFGYRVLPITLNESGVQLVSS